jgi:REP element-mobilizing transposase RayT
MPRKNRVEYEGAIYHLINRGNYRSFIFESEGARKSFLKCLDETCKSMHWRLYAWCLMGNHYHLCIETPQPNLVEGMRWLQSTFANRFNRFRKVNGHVFQGRYQAILLDEDALGAVAHYIHLNPVRAGLVEVDSLQSYAQSSFARLWYPSRRANYEYPQVALAYAGGLSDSPAGRRKYRDYLSWLAASEGEQKQLGFEKMTKGWIKGSKEFKKSVLEGLGDDRIHKVVEADAAEMREPLWNRSLDEALEVVGRKRSELRQGKKGEEWKVSIARYLRERHLTPNRWIAEHMEMGAPSYVQSLVSRHRSNVSTQEWKQLQKHGKLD